MCVKPPREITSKVERGKIPKMMKILQKLACVKKCKAKKKKYSKKEYVTTSHRGAPKLSNFPGKKKRKRSVKVKKLA